MEAPITKFQAPRKRDSNIEALVLIGVTVVLAIIIAIVVIMVKFCGGLWLSPLPQDFLVQTSNDNEREKNKNTFRSHIE